ncbi:MAG: hypothetical protein AMXMBFR59_23690 [Rhodanobacteraceae bacterium]
MSTHDLASSVGAGGIGAVTAAGAGAPGLGAGTGVCAAARPAQVDNRTLAIRFKRYDMILPYVLAGADRRWKIREKPEEARALYAPSRQRDAACRFRPRRDRARPAGAAHVGKRTDAERVLRSIDGDPRLAETEAAQFPGEAIRLVDVT